MSLSVKKAKPVDWRDVVISLDFPYSFLSFTVYYKVASIVVFVRGVFLLIDVFFQKNDTMK